MYPSQFVVGCIAVRHHLAVRAEGFIRNCQSRMPVLQYNRRKFASLNPFPVSAFVEHLLHLGWLYTHHSVRIGAP